MNRAEIKAQAKAQLQGNVGKVFLCMLVLFAIGFVAGLIPMIGSIAAAVVTPPLSVGLILVYLKLSRHEETSVKTLFDGFQYFGNSILLTILISVFTFLWSLLFVIPGIIKTYSYSMAFYILAENPELSASEALNESKEITKGHKLELFILELSFLPWYLLTGITFGIASIYVVPYVNLTKTNFYHQIKRQPQVVVEEEI